MGIILLEFLHPFLLFVRSFTLLLTQGRPFPFLILCHRFLDIALAAVTIRDSMGFSCMPRTCVCIDFELQAIHAV